MSSERVPIEENYKELLDRIRALEEEKKELSLDLDASEFRMKTVRAENKEEIRRKDAFIEQMFEKLAKNGILDYAFENSPPTDKKELDTIAEMKAERLHLNGQIQSLKKDLQTEYLKTSKNMKCIEKMKAAYANMVESYKKEVACLTEKLKNVDEQAKNSTLGQEARMDNNFWQSRLVAKLKKSLQTEKNYVELLKEKKDEFEGQNGRLKGKVDKLTTQISKIQEENDRILDELRILKRREDRGEENTTCLICKSDMYEDAVQFEQLPKCTVCKKRYHGECITRWFAEKVECPVCRNDGSEMENLNRYINNLNIQ